MDLLKERCCHLLGKSMHQFFMPHDPKKIGKKMNELMEEDSYQEIFVSKV